MLQVKLATNPILVPTFTGEEYCTAVVDKEGKKYALLQKDHQLRAWTGNVDESSVPCVLVDDFVLTGDETLLQELAIVGEIRQGNAVLTVDLSGYHMRDARNIFGRFRHDLPLDSSVERIEAHWAGFVANMKAGTH